MRILFILLAIFCLASPALASPPLAPAAEMARVEIFVTSWCPYCKLLEGHLKSSGIPYKKYDIEKDATGRRMHEELGGGGVPVTRVDGRTIIHGFDPAAIQSALRRKGETV